MYRSERPPNFKDAQAKVKEAADDPVYDASQGLRLHPVCALPANRGDSSLQCFLRVIRVQISRHQLYPCLGSVGFVTNRSLENLYDLLFEL
jgi:hypothetical protein